MRRAVPELTNPVSARVSIPAMYLDDPLTQAFVAAIDDMLAPAIQALDCLESYFQPDLAPAEFLDWLGDWLGSPVEPNWPEPLRRMLVGRAVELHRGRGTARCIEMAVRLVTGGQVQVHDSGRAVASNAPSIRAPSSAGPAGVGLSSGASPAVRVSVRVADPTAIDQSQVRAVLAATVPAHIPVTLEVTGS